MGSDTIEKGLMFISTTCYLQANEDIAKGEARLDNDKAIEGFLVDVEKRAYVMAKIAVGNSEDALDLLQDAMLAFIKSYPKRPQNEWPALFHRVLQNRIRDWYRRTQVRNRWRVWFKSSTDEGEDILEAFPDETAIDPLANLCNEGLNGAIIGALEGLPIRQQQTFMLRVWEGFSVADTAVAMGCSEGSVKTHLYRAINTLRSALGEYRE